MLCPGHRPDLPVNANTEQCICPDFMPYSYTNRQIREHGTNCKAKEQDKHALNELEHRYLFALWRPDKIATILASV